LFAPGAGAPTKTITPGRGELKPVPMPGGTSTSSSAVQQENSPIEPAGALRCSHPGRVLLQDYDNRESERMPVPPGKDEHQLVRSAAGALAHRASRRATLFAPGAGAPCMLRRDQLIRLLTSYRGGRMLLEAAWTDLVCRVAPRLITNLEEYPEAGLARLRMTRSRRHQVRGRGTGNYCDRKSAEGELT